MLKNTLRKRFFICFLISLVSWVLIFGGISFAKKDKSQQLKGPWWNTIPEDENPAPKYDSILYSEIGPKLREIEQNSNRVKVEVMGQSAAGRNLFLVTISAPGTSGRYGHIKSLRKMMIQDPEKALKQLDQFKSFKVPVFINGSIHGNEYEGTDACIRLIETLAYKNTPEVMAILDNVVLLINVVQNPDGRVLGTRRNSAGVDINRDFITQTQPETRATVKVITEWNPMVFLDLHDDWWPMLIEPCSPPHNPNYEYDLYIKWALYQAYAMEAELVANTDETEATIPFRDWDFTDIGWSWDDWPPIYTPMYAMYHGSYGATLETPYEDERGVDAHYWAVWGALKFAAANRMGMVKDQIEIFRRGFFDLPQALIPDEILDETAYDQFNELTIKEFPAAYVIPVDGPMQLSAHQPAQLVDFLLFNDIQVEKAEQTFSMDDVSYPEGTYIVWMDQPKRGLANAILEDGMDVSYIEGLVFYSPPTAWSHPLLWGVERKIMAEKMAIETSKVNKPSAPKGSISGDGMDLFTFAPTSLAAFKAVNELIKQGVPLFRSKLSGAFFIPAGSSWVNTLKNTWALDLTAVEALPEDAVAMKSQKIAVMGDEGVAICLKELGFDFDSIETGDIEAGALLNYDLFINRQMGWPADDPIQTALTEFFNNGGDYIGLHGTWTAFASAELAIGANLIDVTLSGVNWDADGIIRMTYSNPDGIAAGFKENDYGYVLNGIWFASKGEGVTVSASIAGTDFLVAGSWPGWQTSSAAGKDVVVHMENSEKNSQDTALIGIDATFRGHPKNTFRLVGNAIFSGLE